MAHGWNATVPVSHALDVLGTVEGSLLVRRIDRWRTLTPPVGHDGWVLGVNGEYPPHWVEPSTVMLAQPNFFFPAPEPPSKNIAGIQRVSDALDFITAAPGSLLVRLAGAWSVVEYPFDPDGRILATNADNVVGWIKVTNLPWWPY